MFRLTIFALLFTSTIMWSEERTRLMWEDLAHNDSLRDSIEAGGKGRLSCSTCLHDFQSALGPAVRAAASSLPKLIQVAQSDDEDVSVQAKKPAPRTQASNTGPVVSRPAATSSVAAKQPSDQPDPNDYIIGEQDNLTITVWKEKELSGNVVVRPDGKITVPLVGETKVVGLTPIQVQDLLEEKLKPFIAVPQVTVAVSQINSRRVYLIGQVVKEGSYQINSSTTVLQLIAQAGGLRDFAKRKNIYILRNQGSDQNRFSFNYEAVVRGKNQDQNILLQPGDTIVVP